MMNTGMEGKVALVTGASGGIGLATAQRFAEAGASVVLSARREAIITRKAERLLAAGYRLAANTANIADEAQSASVARASWTQRADRPYRRSAVTEIPS